MCLVDPSRRTFGGHIGLLGCLIVKIDRSIVATLNNREKIKTDWRGGDIYTGAVAGGGGWLNTLYPPVPSLEVPNHGTLRACG